MLEGVDDCRLEIKRARLLYHSFSLFSSPGNLIKAPPDLFYYWTHKLSLLQGWAGCCAVILIKAPAIAIVEFLPPANWAEIPLWKNPQKQPQQDTWMGFPVTTTRITIVILPWPQE